MCELPWVQPRVKVSSQATRPWGYTLATTDPGTLSLYSNQPPAVDLAIDTGLDLGL